jgi:hypothetical protein
MCEKAMHLLLYDLIVNPNPPTVFQQKVGITYYATLNCVYT